MLIKVKSAVSWMRARCLPSHWQISKNTWRKSSFWHDGGAADLSGYLQPASLYERAKVAIKRSDDLNSGSLNFGLFWVPLTPVPQKMRCI